MRVTDGKPPKSEFASLSPLASAFSMIGTSAVMGTEMYCNLFSKGTVCARFWALSDLKSPSRIVPELMIPKSGATSFSAATI